MAQESNEENDSPHETEAKGMCTPEDTKAAAEEAGVGVVDAVAEEKKDGEEKTEEQTEEDKKKWVDWPFRNIKEPHPNDVLYGRGGGTNHHPGNKRYRKKVEDRKVEYVNCKRLDKPLVALSIIREWRGQGPPGRFLKMDDKTGLWNDVGDKKAREKTSQALREKAPQIRQEIEKEERAKNRAERGESTDEEEELTKNTRFASGTNGKPGMVARDHSLGVEFVDPDAGVDINGFSWQEPVRTASQGSFVGGPPQMPYGHPGVRMGSHGSVGSYGPPPPPMPPAPPHGSDAHARYASWGRYESWGSMQGIPPAPMGYPYGANGPNLSGCSWVSREHSLGQNPLTHASVSQAAYPAAFDGRTGSGHWGGPAQQSYQGMQGPPQSPVSMPPPQHPQQYYSSGGPPPGSYPQAPPVHRREYSREFSNQQQQPQMNAPPSPPYTVDPAVASQWSGQDAGEIAKSMSGGSAEERDSFNPSPALAPVRKTAQVMPKPDLVKRATSNQNETVETKPDYDGQSVKRAALNRDSSTAANALKAKYMPEYFNAKKEVELLSSNLQQSTLDHKNGSAPKPAPMGTEDRMTTLDMTALDLVVKPVSLGATSRSSTIEALNLDFDDEPLVRPGAWDRSVMDDLFNEVPPPPPRPPTISTASRLTTTDLIDIVNEPLPLTEV